MTSYLRVPVPEPEKAGLGKGRPGPAVRAGVEALEGRRIVVHPTQTVYGLGAGPRALDVEIARLKGRRPERPLLRIGADEGALRREHPELGWGRRAERLADRFWPGPLTLVLPDGSGGGVGVRVEGHVFTRCLLREWGSTMSSTSLNLSGEKPARGSEVARRVLDAMPEARHEVVWLDAGELPPSPPSTVLSLLREEAELLRQGAVEVEALEACLGEEVRRG